MGTIHVGVINNQSELDVDRSTIVQAVRAILEEAAIQKAHVSVVVVDDPTIHDLNRRFLDHDYPTDVLSFQLTPGPRNLEGEVVVSADTARSSAAQYGWSAWEELLLYIIHGALHLVDYDDDTPKHRTEMRVQEQAHLAKLGVKVPHRDKRPEERKDKGSKAPRHTGAKGSRSKSSKAQGQKGPQAQPSKKARRWSSS